MVQLRSLCCPEVGQRDLSSGQLQRSEARDRASHIVDCELFDKVRFHNVTAPVLVFPLRPVKPPILSTFIERSRPCLPLD